MTRLLIPILSLIFLPLAQAGTFGDLSYRVVDDSIEITGFDPTRTGHFDIPNEIEGKPVTSIAEAKDGNPFLPGITNSFSYSQLTSVTIPNTVTHIGENAFILSKLTSISFPDSVTHIGKNAFYAVPLQTIEFGANITHLDLGCFGDCASLTEVSFPPSLRSIGERCFKGCRGLERIDFGQAATSIGERAFMDCPKLRTVHIPNTITSFASFIFQSCTGLTTVSFDPQITTVGYGMFSGCSALTEVTLPENLTSISPTLLSQCSSLRSISLPNTIKTINRGAFTHCTSLESVAIPNQVEVLGEGVFTNCSNLHTVVFPATLGQLQNGGTVSIQFLFPRCPKLKNILFLGDAVPTFPTFDSTHHPNARVYFLEGNSGFTNPTWRGFPTEMIPSQQATTAAWLLANQLALGTDLNQDLNNDGYPLLMSYALDLDPHQNLASVMPHTTMTDQSLSLQFSSTSPGITYTVEQSEDLKTWTSTGITTSDPNAFGITTATLPTDPNGQQKFLRLSVTTQ